jgi:hypothetical protein
MNTAITNGRIRTLVHSKPAANTSMALTAKEMQMERELNQYQVVVLVGGPDSGKHYHTPTGEKKFVNDPHETYRIGKCLYRPAGALGNVLKLEFIGRDHK